MFTKTIKMLGLGLGLVTVVGLLLSSSAPALAKLQPPTYNQPVAVAAAPAAALVQIELCATKGDVTMPDGAVVPIWGFSHWSASFGCSNSAQLPGPVLEATAGDTIEVTLHNPAGITAIGSATSILFPGLTGVTATGISGFTAPTAANGLFTYQADPGGVVKYTFTVNDPGTYLYESGTDTDKQVAMGLYGALVVKPVSPTYTTDEVLVLSEIDPLLNANPDTFSMHDYHPTYWLINGQAYPATPNIEVEESASETTLRLRYLNAGAINHTMSLLGLHQEIVARDGYDLPTSYQVYAETTAVGQTLEADIVIPAAPTVGDTFPLFNRQFHITNAGVGGGGGMMTFIEVVAVGP